MPAALDIWIDAVVIRGNQSYAICNDLMNHANALGDQLTAHNWEGAATQAYLMANDFNDLRDYGHFRRVMGQYYNAIALYWISDNWPTGNGAEVTMDSILAAMVTAEPDEFQYFIGLVDAYRAALWEKPFNAEFYAALARGFMEK